MMGKSRKRTSTRYFALNNNMGMSIIEVLIALGMAGVLSLVVASVMESVQKSQKQTNVVATITGMRESIQRLILDGAAWNQTAADPTPDATGTDPLNKGGMDPINRGIPQFACLANRTGCTHTTPITPPPPPGMPANADYAPYITLPVLSDAAGVRYLKTDVGNEGFTDQGAPCTTFSMAGSDDCPIRWELKVQYTCPSSSPTYPTCVDPGVRVFGLLYYRPNPNNPMRSIVNELKYRVDVTRGSRGENKFEPFEAVFGSPAAPDTVPGPAPGPCSPGNWTDINFNTIGDWGDGNATLPGDGTVRILAGTYYCTGAVSCFDCGSVRGRVLLNGAVHANASGTFVGPYSSGIDSFTSFHVVANAPAILRLQQYCERHPTNPADINYGLGISSRNYGNPTRWAYINCTRQF